MTPVIIAAATTTTSKNLSRGTRQSPSIVEIAAAHAIVQSKTFSLRDTAAVLGISERSLQRYLTRSGTSFSELSERARFEMARSQLRSTKLSIADISRRLGYWDPSSFSRAFRRWSGQSPRSYRRQHGTDHHSSS